MQYRKLGKTGADLSVIGFGGIVNCGVDQAEANRRVARTASSCGVAAPAVAADAVMSGPPG